jgi:hypothetical protein
VVDPVRPRYPGTQYRVLQGTLYSVLHVVPAHVLSLAHVQPADDDTPLAVVDVSAVAVGV